MEDYEVTWIDHEDDEVVEPEWCETCGEQVVFVVGWADLELEAEGGAIVNG